MLFLQLFLLFDLTLFVYSHCEPPSVQFRNDYCLLARNVANFSEAKTDCSKLNGTIPTMCNINETQEMFSTLIDNGWRDGVSWMKFEPQCEDAIQLDPNICLIFTVNGTLENRKCAENVSYFCKLTKLSDFYDYYDDTTTTDAVIDEKCPVAPLPAAYPIPTCTLGSHCPQHWFVVAVVAVNNEEDYTYSLNLLDSMVKSCDSSDYALLITPSILNQNLKNLECNYEKVSADYFTHTGSNYGFSGQNNEMNSSDVLRMFQFAQNCSKQSPYESRGKVLYFITNLNCSTLCTGALPYDQRDIISWFADNGFDSEFIHLWLDSTSLCLRDIFSQCSAYTRSQCEVQVLDTTNVAAQQSLEQVLRTCDPWVMPLGATIALVVVSCLSTVGLIVICIMRYKMKRQGTWKNFWRSEAQHKNAEQIESNTDDWELIPGQLEVLENRQLGSGAFAVVYEGILTGKRPVDAVYPGTVTSLSSSGKVAVKRLPPYADVYAKKDFMDEIRFMKSMKIHSHILGMIGCITVTDPPVMALELCELGDLLAFVRAGADKFQTDEDGQLVDKDLVSIAWQISDGLVFLKSSEVIHRDVAARNVLLTTNLTAKISDFGLCRNADSAVYLSRGGRLPIKWMAIEALKTNTFSHQSDVWSFGVLLWEIFSLGNFPYPSVQPAEMVEHLEQGNRLQKPEQCPEEVYKIMSGCWVDDLIERSEIEDIRTELGDLLRASSEYYGYVAVTASERIEENDGDHDFNNERLI